jgi:predicted outer membrane protein
MKNLKNMNSMLLRATFVSTALVFGSVASNTMTAYGQEGVLVANRVLPERVLNEADAQFINATAQSNMEGIRLARLAQSRGSVDHVVELGRGLEEYHQKSLDALAALAKLRNFDLTIANSVESNEAYAMLNNKSGSDFDKSYSDLTVGRLERSVLSLEKASTNSNDLDLRTWSTTEIPPMRDQLTKSINSQRLCDAL